MLSHVVSGFLLTVFWPSGCLRRSFRVSLVGRVTKQRGPVVPTLLDLLCPVALFAFGDRRAYTGAWRDNQACRGRRPEPVVIGRFHG
ncbi:Hypothetical protein RAK1035_0719 [Roseovarius sp. AK1035]|nr:Hypothetical protein RAK1035_0719 [Roseovarius sp. AK1035]